MKRISFGIIIATALVTTIFMCWPAAVNSHAQTLTTQDKLLNLWSLNSSMPPAWQESLHAYTYKVMAKAQPDECYYGLGNDLNRASFDEHFPNWLSKDDIKNCVGTWIVDHYARPKTNQSYIWGLTKSGNNLWFGTAANNICRGPVTLLGSPLPAYQTDSWVCEESGKDARPPRMFMFDTLKSKLFDLTPEILAKGPESVDVLRLNQTVGIRSAGAFGGVVFFGGVSVAVPQGEPWDVYTVVLFAFNASTKAYLGSYIYDGSDATHPWYTNIRQWIVAGGTEPQQKHLYVGVGTTVNPYFGFSGKVLRWTGSVADPFQFENVGSLTADPAYLVEYKGRLVSSTWGGDSLGGFVLYMSPEFGDDHMLTADDKDAWDIKWRVSEYEPEGAAVVSGGAIGVEGDALIWGTLQAPTTGLLAYLVMHPFGPTDATGLLNAFFGTLRPISIFRAHNLEDDGARQVELLYGSPYLPKFNDLSNEWEIVPNNMDGATPLMGPIGMGNVFNTYTWWMENYRGKLFVGTFDYLYVAPRLLAALVLPQGTLPPELPKDLLKLARQFEGADLWAFDDDHTPALPVSLNGAGNYTNYGIRTMITLNGSLYLGAANAMNLLTTGKYRGGFELIKVIPAY